MMFSIPNEIVIAYAIRDGELVAPNVIRFNDQLYHFKPELYGYMWTVTVSDCPIISFGWD